MQKAKNPVISVVVPAYNEAGSIAQTLEQMEATLDSLYLPYEVIVVDDGSIDKTKQLASGNGAIVISYGTNHGKGHALKIGLARAKGQILVTIDADGSHRPSDLLKIIKPILMGTDVVIGSRFLSKNKEITSKLNILGNNLFNFLIRIITKKKISDSQSGFRAFKRKVLKGIVLFSEGYDIETELTIKSLRNGFSIHEEPIKCDKRTNGESKISYLSDGISILKTILKSSFI